MFQKLRTGKYLSILFNPLDLIRTKKVLRVNPTLAPTRKEPEQIKIFAYAVWMLGWRFDPALGFEELDGSSTRQKLSTVASSRRRIGAFRIDRVPRARGQSGR